MDTLAPASPPPLFKVAALSILAASAVPFFFLNSEGNLTLSVLNIACPLELY